MGVEENRLGARAHGRHRSPRTRQPTSSQGRTSGSAVRRR
jgi:hypothetical protein